MERKVGISIAAVIVAIILLVPTIMNMRYPPGEISGDMEDDWYNGPFRPFSVVAPVDTGINPYHIHFQMNETLPKWFLDTFSVTIICNLTREGTYSERVEADMETCWDLITYQDVVYFNGTRIIGAMGDDRKITENDLPILDEGGHGTAVTGAVIDANPDAIIFFVEGFSDNAVRRAADQPLVDVITTSFGPIFSLPVPGIEKATKYAVLGQGKMHTGASDNSRAPAIQDPTAGPPWAIGVAGFQEDGNQGKEAYSGTFADLIADWTQVLPNMASLDKYHQTSGTSFATPRTAGILSRTIQMVRTEVGDNGSGANGDRNGNLVVGNRSGSTFTLSNHDIRDGLNQSGWYPDIRDYDPGNQENRAPPINPVSPWLQAGWGVMDLDTPGKLAPHLLGTKKLPDRDPRCVAYMENLMQVRRNYWDGKA